MSESRLLSRKGAIYFVLAFAVVTLIILNFWGWFFLRGIERQILRQLGQQLNNTARVYALQISEKFFFEDILMLPQSDLRLLPLQQLLYEYRETGDLENIFIVSVDKAQLIDGEVSLNKRQRLQDFPLNDSLFRKAVLGQQPEAERITFAGQYFVTTYTPVFDFSGNVIAILVSEAPAHIFTTLQFFRRTLLYAGILGLTAIIFFGTLIVLAIRRLFQAEEKLYQQARLAQLGQMAAMVAHEIRNPLSIIKGSADVLRKKYSSQNDELFDFIPDEINRLNRLVNDFLQFARRRDLKLEKQNPLDIINSILQQLNDPRIQTGFANPAPELMLDSDSFKQVMLNIIDNARQAISAEGNILVRTEVSRPRQFIIEIEDNGAGMSPENLKKIFDPFFSTRATGSGLGMAITKQLVEQMNGKVSVFSKERQGTTVKLEFPV
jgi:signal transduction histidine kinase